MNNQKATQPDTLFTIPADKVKITGAHVYFALYANGAKVGDLCMTQAEFKMFEATVCDDTMHERNFELASTLSKHFNMMEKGWKVLCIEKMLFWKNGHAGYQQNIKDAGDFSYEKAKKIVDKNNEHIHDESAKIVGAEELLIYHPTPD